MHTIIIFFEILFIFLIFYAIIWILHLYVTAQSAYVINSAVVHLLVSEKFLFSVKRDPEYIHMISRF